VQKGFRVEINRAVRQSRGQLMTARPQKITFGEMRDDMGVRGVLVYCADQPSVALSADGWADDVRLSDIETRFVCAACGKRGADVRLDFNWNRSTVLAMMDIGIRSRTIRPAAIRLLALDALREARPCR
jgi:hypothetical protein